MLASLNLLLQSIVDYAGLFPPAQLDLRSAMEQYAENAASPAAWMLSRFVLPAAQLPELSKLLSDLPLPQWSLSVVVSSLQEVEQILPLQTDRLKIAALEFTPRSPAEIDALIEQLPPSIDAFFEVPLDSSFNEAIAVLQGTAAAAKIRTGGMTATAFPNRESLARWISACAQARIPFKATAGLHHPVPGLYRFTDAADSPSAYMHGFLNVAIAAAFAYHQAISAENLLQLLEIDALENVLQFQNDKLIWNSSQPQRQLDLLQIQTARQHCFRSFGSCSFREPIDDLQQLGFIPR